MSTPVKPMHRQGIITKNEMISPTVAHLTVRTTGALPPFKAGQFCWVTLEKDGEKLKRPYSIASAPWEEELALCIKRVPEGTVSTAITGCAEGTAVDVFAPLGLFTLPEHHDQDAYLFIGVGTGVAPYRSMLRELFTKHYSGRGEDTRKHVTLLFGAKNQEEAIYKEEFEALATKHKNFNYHITLSRENATGALEGYVQHHIGDLLTQPEKTSVYICGLKHMVIEVNKACQARGVPRQHIHEEIY